jgi:hypothetical protein
LTDEYYNGRAGLSVRSMDMPEKKIAPIKIVFMVVVIAVAAGIFCSVISNITHSFDALNAPSPEQK